MPQTEIKKFAKDSVCIKKNLMVTECFKMVVLIITCVLSASQVNAQKVLEKSMTLQMPGPGGSNSCAVVWHPKLKKYYTSMAGNSAYPMAVFDAKGVLISDSLVAEFDYRGMWYNTVSKQIEFNCYNNTGWGHFRLDDKGAVIDRILDFEGLRQPDPQSAGVYYEPDNMVLFLNEKLYKVELYNAKTALFDNSLMKIYPGCLTDNDVLVMNREKLEKARWSDRNSVVQYTGKSKQELAVLNVTEHKIELYNLKTGLITDIYLIPHEVKLNSFVNFSYANNLWWFFNKAERKWDAYKL